MAPVNSVEIILDEQNKVFYPRDEVKGRVYLRLTEDMKIKSILVGFHGDSLVQHYQDKTHYELQLPYFDQTSELYDQSKSVLISVKISKPALSDRLQII
jgi:hypothetical protein